METDRRPRITTADTMKGDDQIQQQAREILIGPGDPLAGSLSDETWLDGYRRWKAQEHGEETEGEG